MQTATVTTSFCYQLGWWCLSAEAWAAWAQAVMSASAIVAALMISQWQTRRQLRASAELVRVSHQLAIQTRTAPLFAHCTQALLSLRMAVNSVGIKLLNDPIVFLWKEGLLSSVNTLKAFPMSEQSIESVTATNAFIGCADACIQMLEQSEGKSLGEHGAYRLKQVLDLYVAGCIDCVAVLEAISKGDTLPSLEDGKLMRTLNDLTGEPAPADVTNPSSDK